MEAPPVPVALAAAAGGLALGLGVLGAGVCLVQRAQSPRERVSPAPQRFSAANVNTGGQFGNVFEFIMREPCWVEKYDAMLRIFDSPAPSQVAKDAGATWRALYCDASLDLSLENKIDDRPNVLKGDRKSWFDGDVDSYLADWDDRCLHGKPKTKAHEDLRIFDLFCQISAKEAFPKGLNDYLLFEKDYLHVARDYAGLEAKLTKLLEPLMSAEVQFIAVEEAFRAVDFSVKDASDEARSVKIRQTIELVSVMGKGQYSAVYKRDAELLILWRDSKAPRIFDLAEGCNRLAFKSPGDAGTMSFLDVAHCRPDEVQRDAKAAKAAPKAMETTRCRTMCLQVGDVSVFAVHAKEHAGCADLLAEYFGNLVASVNKAGAQQRPCVILSDTNVEKPKDVATFDAEIDKLGMLDAHRGQATTYKERTVFQGQPNKASVPPQTGRNGAVKKGGFVFAPKDRVLTAGCALVSSQVHPAPPAALAIKSHDDEKRTSLLIDQSMPRLPSRDWPSDHLAVLAQMSVPAPYRIPSEFLTIPSANIRLAQNEPQALGNADAV